MRLEELHKIKDIRAGETKMKPNYDGKLVTLNDFIEALERRPKRTNTPKIDMDYTLIVSVPSSQKKMYELDHDSRLPFYSL